ncbi:MAG: WbqC family protein [Paludibacter sp.]|nr:WbqC family protein [Bacteroidales bacterium]MCM1069929.1 WbqC family protein [Prevotella sp.]MCM1354654.1 WbqC family protein [Bacteroides sp.]MCM1443505.1 WbqC family protein [Muribaculum sp.]MCM1482611.1 WbqC family protein [Paludibacter sp.]
MLAAKVFPTAYLAPVSYWQKWVTGQNEGLLLVEQYESFPKQTLRNRCVIAGPNGAQTLTVPVCRSESKQFTKDVRISYQTKWQHQHRTALISAYKNTPFFDYYQDFFLPLYQKHFDYLLDFNLALHQSVCRLLELPCDVLLTDNWEGADETVFEGDCTPYWQMFADKPHGFLSNLSIVDLLFNLGPEAQLYLHANKKS